MTGNFPVIPRDDDGTPDPYDLADPVTGAPLGDPDPSRRFCAAIQCGTELPDDDAQRAAGQDLYVCRQHYYRLSWALRNALRESYKRVTVDGWRPTLEFCEAAESAVRLLARKDGVKVTGKEEVLVELARVRAEIEGKVEGKEVPGADRA